MADGPGSLPSSAFSAVSEVSRVKRFDCLDLLRLGSKDEELMRLGQACNERTRGSKDKET